MTTKTKSPRIAFIKARWHADVVDRAHEGFLAEAATLIPGAVTDAFDVPGAFEMPLLAKKLAQTGRYDAVVAAALVVDGGIYRHDFVAAAVVNGLMQAGLETGVPCFSVSLTPHNYQETELHTGFFREHFVKKGAEAANAVAQMLTLEAELSASAQSAAA
ncbi:MULTISPECIES: 6,7-dimethyl-8-ribityllumazine synthase [Paracoccus]|uniref:6,7-dimethyl-8-ribityllumazine synthase n=1 Tax=Paracoccus litorisediminis TaxID=2006130 RepID=A0A844HPA1_9RHOB|nr:MULTISPECIES: 6,7-dimethyl-8-ribityllumazine synthase [Paracoccus]MBD9527366.1 6,7-dimethyl-8-ribityllumazine synthase [Paracoccus sp. PAR01]MTH60234.1 6,7-dimethyl-8-ribityllumazine synthase [Paracoccus litorisediminis]